MTGAVDFGFPSPPLVSCPEGDVHFANCGVGEAMEVIPLLLLLVLFILGSGGAIFSSA
jgi:hypothetical protein